MDILDKDYIEKKLANSSFAEVAVFDKIDSTSNFARNAEAQSVIIANEQTSGRGRVGKSFLSKKGGLYFSLVLDKTVDGNNLTAKTAVAVALAIEEIISDKVEIKWVNDIFYKNKKVAGILTESLPDKYIVGIGINVYPVNFAQEGLVATSLLKSQNQKFSRSDLAVNIITKLENILQNDSFEYMTVYRNKSAVLGKQIRYTKNQCEYVGVAQEILDDCGLKVALQNGQTDILSSGEVSIIL